MSSWTLFKLCIWGRDSHLLFQEFLWKSDISVLSYGNKSSWYKRYTSGYLDKFFVVLLPLLGAAVPVCIESYYSNVLRSLCTVGENERFQVFTEVNLVRSCPPVVFLGKGVLKIVALQLYWNHISAWVFSCKFAAYFQNTFLEDHLWRAASYLV